MMAGHFCCDKIHIFSEHTDLLLSSTNPLGRRFHLLKAWTFARIFDIDNSNLVFTWVNFRNVSLIICDYKEAVVHSGSEFPSTNQRKRRPHFRFSEWNTDLGRYWFYWSQVWWCGFCWKADLWVWGVNGNMAWQIWTFIECYDIEYRRTKVYTLHAQHEPLTAYRVFRHRYACIDRDQLTKCCYGEA